MYACGPSDRIWLTHIWVYCLTQTANKLWNCTKVRSAMKSACMPECSINWWFDTLPPMKPAEEPRVTLRSNQCWDHPRNGLTASNLSTPGILQWKILVRYRRYSAMQKILDHRFRSCITAANWSLSIILKREEHLPERMAYGKNNSLSDRISLCKNALDWHVTHHAIQLPLDHLVRFSKASILPHGVPLTDQVANAPMFPIRRTTSITSSLTRPISYSFLLVRLESFTFFIVFTLFSFSTVFTSK